MWLQAATCRPTPPSPPPAAWSLLAGDALSTNTHCQTGNSQTWVSLHSSRVACLSISCSMLHTDSAPPRRRRLLGAAMPTASEATWQQSTPFTSVEQHAGHAVHQADQPQACPSLLRDEAALLQLLGSHAESAGAGLTHQELSSLQLSQPTCSWPRDSASASAAGAVQAADTSSGGAEQQQIAAAGTEHDEHVSTHAGRRLLAAAGDVAAPACPANVSCSQDATAVFAGLTAAGRVVTLGCTQVRLQCCSSGTA